MIQPSTQDFISYEVSNFARLSIHNLNYWESGEWVGSGAELPVLQCLIWFRGFRTTGELLAEPTFSFYSVFFLEKSNSKFVSLFVFIVQMDLRGGSKPARWRDDYYFDSDLEDLSEFNPFIEEESVTLCDESPTGRKARKLSILSISDEEFNTMEESPEKKIKKANKSQKINKKSEKDTASILSTGVAKKSK